LQGGFEKSEMSKLLVQRLQSRLSARDLAIRFGEQGRASLVPGQKIVEIVAADNGRAGDDVIEPPLEAVSLRLDA
jgi:hypothetical protein